MSDDIAGLDQETTDLLENVQEVVPAAWLNLEQRHLNVAETLLPELQGWKRVLFHHMISYALTEVERQPLKTKLEDSYFVAPSGPLDSPIGFWWHYPTHDASVPTSMDPENSSTRIIDKKSRYTAGEITSHGDKVSHECRAGGDRQPYLNEEKVDQRLRVMFEVCWVHYMRASRSRLIVLMGEVQYRTYKAAFKDVAEIAIDNSVEIYGRPGSLLVCKRSNGS